ncbi:MAG: triose-phosphate isomerase [Oligoflexia bacterium]|nr:triose-phosphate isomerase [Oligoflexia bacterium]
MPPKVRGVLIAGNWKMNYGPKETEAYFRAMAAQAPSLPSDKLRACLIPPAVSLATAQHLASQNPFPITIAAQNAHWELKGAFTGELSGPMLKEIGLSTVLIGHSERRQFFGETDETVRKRADSLIAQGFEVILCIGETRAEREAHQTEAVLRRQLDEGVSAAALSSGKLIIAYEPVWAIGTGLTATPGQAQEAHAFIRGHLKKTHGAIADKIVILYGGSVTPENIDSLLACPDVDGGLVGGASLKPESFLALLSKVGRTFW